MSIQISNRTIEALARVITGDGKISPYRSGPKLVTFFNEHGANESYGQGFPSRCWFAQEQIKAFNNTASLTDLIQDSVDPRHYLETEFDAKNVVDHLNKYLKFDGFQLLKRGLNYILQKIQSSSPIKTEFESKLDPTGVSHAFILEQCDKAREKYEGSDFDGAITTSRSMVEAVFQDTLEKLGSDNIATDGDLNQLFKEVKKHLRLDPSEVDFSNTEKQFLSGLNSIVTGLAGMSNQMGDRHSRKYKPEKHHALLAINTAYALTEFILDRFSKMESQKETV